MKRFSFALIVCLPLFGKIDPTDWARQTPANEEEAFFLRRIADFWQEGEYGIAKTQMEEFLSSFPDSPYADLVRLCLGDVFLREKNFSKALASYAALSSDESKEKSFPHRMQCLYGLEWYSTLADECEAYLKQAQDPELKQQATFYLAISLYHQCLNASKDPETLFHLAKRAEPHFETLLQSEKSFEVTQAFAHLCCILKDFEKAAGIYRDLALSYPALEEEMLFQAAVIQAEYDKNIALHSFEKIATSGGKKAKEAAYNHLVLSFELGRLESIVENRSSILDSIPEDKRGMAHLFLGRSLIGLKKWKEAIQELSPFLDPSLVSSSESIRSGLLCLIEAANQGGDLDSLDGALQKLFLIAPSKADLAKARFCRSQLLKKLGQFEDARLQLQELFAEDEGFSDRTAASFEWVDLEYQAQSWEECRSRASEFVHEFPNDPLAPFAWRYFATASSHIANDHPETRERFSEDLKKLLSQSHLFAAEELNDWTYYLGRTYFQLGWFDQAINILEPLTQSNLLFSQKGNAYLLLALCHRDGKEDPAAFCLYGEMALTLDAQVMPPALLHLSLFNAYLELSKTTADLIEKGADHLYQAFLAQADISRENLLWLGERYFAKEDWPRAIELFSSIGEVDETASYKLGLLYLQMGRIDELIAQMEKLISSYHTEAAPPLWEKEAKLLLAQGYEKKGLERKTLDLLDGIIDGNSAIYSETIAKAYLMKARLSASMMKNDPNPSLIAAIASQFKDLILQRRLDQEPIHLEAALDYVEFVAQFAPNPEEKRLSLLEKVKEDFKRTEDLLSKDYAQARVQYPEKNAIFESYMRYIEEEILLVKSTLEVDPHLQKELQAKAKDLLLQIKGECVHQSLMNRVASRLQNIDVSVVE